MPSLHRASTTTPARFHGNVMTSSKVSAASHSKANPATTRIPVASAGRGAQEAGSTPVMSEIGGTRRSTTDNA